MSEHLDKITSTTKYSKFELTREQVEKMTVQQLITINEQFWEQQSVKLHRCYSQGQAYANNSNKKTSINLIQDMFNMLKSRYKNDRNSEQIEHLFNIINTSLQMVDSLENDVDKNCILSIIQGYTLGCLKKYEK